jgi:hypothetical protein
MYAACRARHITQARGQALQANTVDRTFSLLSFCMTVPGLITSHLFVVPKSGDHCDFSIPAAE